MKTEQRLFTSLFIVSITCLVLASSASAAPGVRFWSMNVGNNWVYNGSGGGATWTKRDEVVGIDTTTIPGVATYKVEGRKNGLITEYLWFSTSLAEIKEWREMVLGDIGYGQEWITLAYDSGLVWARNPMIVGGHWATQTTATLSGARGWSYPMNISLDMIILSQEFITLPLGTYKAYKFQQMIHVWTSDYRINRIDILYRWFVPYLGLVKSQDTLGNVASLASLSIRKGIVDFDSDGKTDIAVYRASTGAWYIKPSSGATPYGVAWGISTDTPVPGDYDGDGKTDYAVYQDGAWYVYPSGGGSPYALGWGMATDKPVPGDYDGDGKTDIAVNRLSTGAWYIYPSGGGAPYGFGWGGDPTDKPVPGDYDGDSRADVALYRTETGAWYIYRSGGGGPYGFGWGGDPTDKPVPGDYDSDGKTDCAVYRDGIWFVYPSGGGGPYARGWGVASDKPVPGDYDGDGKTDVAVYRPGTGAWYIIPSGGSSLYGVGWGGDPSDVPLTTSPD